MRPLLLSSLLALALPLAACGSDSTDNSEDRAGPESLEGVAWRGDAVDVGGGVTIQPAFRFTRSTVSLENRCSGGGEEAVVTATAPIRYHYSVRTEGQRSGDDSCYVEIGSGQSTFEVIDGQLQWTYNGQVETFRAAGPVAGLYGEWTADNDVGRFRFSLGGGQITASIDCNTGGSASVTVNADFQSFVDILQPASEEVMEGGLTCNASIQAANNVRYRFDGNALIMVFEGQELRFEP